MIMYWTMKNISHVLVKGAPNLLIAKMNFLVFYRNGNSLCINWAYILLHQSENVFQQYENIFS